MKSKGDKPLPPSAEWDFRSVDDVSLPAATLYEYARSTTVLRGRIAGWLKSEIEGVTVRDHLLAACKKYDAPTTIIDNVPASVAGGIITAGLSAGVPSALVELIIESRPDFPRPWLKVPTKYERNPNFSRLVCVPLAFTMENLEQLPGLANFYRKWDGHYHMSIDWNGATAEEIIQHMERWIRNEARKRTTPKRGRASQAQLWKLKGLAALRLRDAGLTYEEAYKAIQPLVDAQEKRIILPLFENKSSWSDAIKEAKSEIEATERLKD